MKPLKLGIVLASLACAGGLAGCGERVMQVAKGAAPQLEMIGPAPSWTLSDVDGREVSSAEFAGKVIVVDFWATWCGPCREEIPGYVELQKRYSEQGLVILGVSMDRQGSTVVKPFAESFKINYPMLLADRSIGDAFGGVEFLPTTFLIDREGRIRHKKIGAMSMKDYEQLIVPLL